MTEEGGISPGPATLRLAVIIACWNYAEYVDEAIRSVLDQARCDCELIVVDDGSTDGSWDVIQRHPVRAYKIDNCGQRAACSFGVSKTSAQFVLFLDADDALTPGSLATILRELDDNVAKLQFPLVRTDRNGLVIGDPVPNLASFRDNGELAKLVLKNGTYASPPTSGNVFRRDLCEVLKEATYDRAVDGILLFAAPFFGDIVSLSTPLGRYRVHDRNDSGLGRPLDVQILRREIARFSDRMGHLRRILDRIGKAEELVPVGETQYFLERSIYLAIAEGHRVPATMLWHLIGKIWATGNSLKTRSAMVAFLLFTAILPNRNARRGLSYRLDAGDRSMTGLLRALF